MKKLPSDLPRAGLGDTLKALKAPGVPRADAAPRHGGMRRQSFAPNPGGLEMWLHAPQGLPPAAPLVVVLHGCTQQAVAFAGDSGWLALADQSGFAVLAPQQSSANNPNRCFNWFEPQHMQRGGGEPASIVAMIEAAVAQHGLSRDRIYVTGLSAGGAMAAVMLATYPEIFAGGAIVAGLPYGGASGMAQAFQAMQGRGATPKDLRAARGQATSRPPKIVIWHGDADHVVHADNGGQIARQWAAAEGLATEPDETMTAPGGVRAIWRDRTGDVRIELNRVQGLGHGVPLETSGPEGLGRSGAYMLQAGVNSTLETARFWGLVTSDRAQRVGAGPTAARDTPTPWIAPPSGPAPSLGAQVMAAVSAVPPNVQAVIADALTRGGLLK